MSLELSLYTIENDLANLIEMREQAIEEAKGVLSLVGPEAPEYADAVRDVDVIDKQIAEYVRTEIRKVDNIRSFWRHAELMRDAAKAEANRQNERAKSWDGRLQAMRETIRFVMESMPWAPGKPRKLEGRTGSLMLKANGGKQAVEITDEALVPDEFCTVTVTITARQWKQMSDTRPPRTPSLSLIAAEIEKGEGVPGARLAPRGEHVECR